MKRLILFFIILSTISLFAVLPVGTVRTTVATDASGNVINTPLSFSNQVSMVVTATSPFHIVNFAQFTNSIYSTTNRVNVTISGTNAANAYKVQGVLGFTGIVTNNGAGSTNITSYLLGIVTNNVRTP